MNARSAPALLDKLEQRLQQNILLAKTLMELPEAALQQRPAPAAWSALESVAHVNIWNRDYLERVEAALQQHGTSPSATFTSSWLGNQLASALKPGPKTRRIPTLKKLNPINQELDRRELETWLMNADRLEKLLSRARTVDLNRIKIKTVLSSLIVMRLGDVLRMMVYHDWRHLEQAVRAGEGDPVR